MKHTPSHVAYHAHARYEIVPEPGVGFYVFRYADGRSTHDYLQDTFEMATACALEEFGVPIDSWKPGDQRNAADHK